LSSSKGIAVTALVKEGWYEDPADRHEYRWFSQGTPTDLVRDGSQTSRDPISISDPEAFHSMDLAQPPDDGPLLIKPGETQPEPGIRAGIDPLGLRWAVQMGPDAAHSFRFSVVGLGLAIVCEFWFGLSWLTLPFMMAGTLFALVPLFFVGSVLGGRRMQRRMWRAEAEHDPSVLPLLASWRLIRPAEYLGVALILSEAAVLAGLFVRQYRG
jgi:hypothetical protein